MEENENPQNNVEIREEENKQSTNELKKINIFFECIRETLIARIFALSYPISLFFLYKENKMFTFDFTLGIIFVSIIYFICYFIVKLKSYYKDIPFSILIFYSMQILYCILGYLVQFNLMLFDIYVLEENKYKINYILCVLKIFMIIEMIKRVYYYAIGCYIFLDNEINKGDRCMYVMTFEIVYVYLWNNFYNITHIGGFELGNREKVLGIFFSLLNGIFALCSNFMICKIGIIIINAVFLFAHCYSI